jgi:MoaA/NifB/PqqE/SkfB family radical SAM enzyme
MINFPKILQIQPTNRCNLYCLFCDHRKVTKELSDKKWIEIINDAGETKIPRLTITGGGEPLMRKSLTLKIMEIAKKYGMNGDIVTNGTLFDEKSIEKIVKIGWDAVVVSIHGTKQSTDDYLRGGMNSFKRTILVLRKFMRIKRKLKSKSPKLNFLSVVCRQNFEELKYIIKLAKEVGVECVTLKLVNENPYTQGKFSLLPEQLKKLPFLLLKLKEDAKKFGIDFFTDFNVDDLKNENRKIKNNHKEAFCLIPFFEMVIFAEGDCAPCCVFYERPNLKLSNWIDNIKDKALKEVWTGEIFDNLRRLMREHNPPPVCLSCPPDTRYRHSTWSKFLTTGEKIRYLY